MPNNPVVTWQPWPTVANPAPTAIRVLHPEVDLAKYTFSYNPETFTATATTPSMTLTSMSLTGEFYKEELAALQSWYGNPIVMEKYASGVTKTAEEAEARYKTLADRWTAGLPYSGLMARNSDGKLVAMFNLGYAVDNENKVRPGITEFAGVVDPDNWNKGLASEAMILMLVVNQYLCDNGYEIADAPLAGITTAVRTDNEWADRALQNSALTFKFQKESYVKTRNVYEASSEELKDILVNTERSRNEDGNFLASTLRV